MMTADTGAAACAGFYPSTAEAIRAREYAHTNGETYLDHAGSTLYARSLVERHTAELCTSYIGNAHSAVHSGAGGRDRVDSRRSPRRLIDEVRANALDLLEAGDHYDLLFTGGATASIKLVGELMTSAHGRDWCYRYSRDSHTSLVGLRELSDDYRAFDFGGDMPHSLPGKPMLVAWPGKSNFSGKSHPCTVDLSSPSCAYTLYDAAALAGTSPLELVPNGPDFVVLSFYKMFGYPQGLGALLVKRTAALVSLAKQRKFFGGGTVAALSSSTSFVAKRAANLSDLHSRLEDGSPPVQLIQALRIALQLHKELYGAKPFHNISAHIALLSKLAAARLSALKHYNGRRAVKLLEYQNGSSILTMSLLRPTGKIIGYAEVQQLAELSGIHIRCGSLCNPGDAERLLGWQANDIEANFAKGHTCGDEMDVIDDRATGAIRISLGAMSASTDIDRWVRFIKDYFVIEAQEWSSMRGFDHDAQNVALQRVDVYPIKSCRGYSVPYGERWNVMPYGLEFDRQWAIVGDDGNQVLSQKRHTTMALLSPSIDRSSGLLALSSPAGILFQVGLRPDEAELEHRAHVGLCGDATDVLVYRDPTITAALTAFLGVTCHLGVSPGATQASTWPSTSRRYAKVSAGACSDLQDRPRGLSDYGVPEQGAGWAPQKAQILLSNESPFLCINSESVNALRNVCPENDRGFDQAVFRANFTIGVPASSSVRPYDEDDWQSLKIVNAATGGIVAYFQVLGKCRRCLMIGINQETGDVSAEPYKTLSRVRKLHGRLWFGIHLGVIQYNPAADTLPTVGPGDRIQVR